MAYSREIIKKILQNVRFRIPTTEEKDSYYSEIGNTLIRISNHCTRLRVWDYMLEKNPKWKGKPIISIVFEDRENTFDENDCLVLSRYRMKPIKVKEYVYNLQNNPQFITNADEKLIIKAIKGISNGQYTDLTNKCAEPVLRISQNPPDEPPNSPKKLNCNRNMKKKLIRLTEQDLHRIVKESVNKVLKEDGMPSISYPHNWGNDGTHYNQTIKIGLTQEDLDELNSKLGGMSDKLGTQNEDGLVDPDSSMRSAYIKENLPLQFGKNYLKLSTLYSLAELLNWGAYKRVKLNRNTILLIVRI